MGIIILIIIVLTFSILLFFNKNIVTIILINKEINTYVLWILILKININVAIKMVATINIIIKTPDKSKLFFVFAFIATPLLTFNFIVH